MARLIHSSEHEIRMILVNCAELFQVTDELALEAGLAPPFQTQIYLSQSVFLTKKGVGEKQAKSNNMVFLGTAR